MRWKCLVWRNSSIVCKSATNWVRLFSIRYVFWLSLAEYFLGLHCKKITELVPTDRWFVDHIMSIQSYASTFEKDFRVKFNKVQTVEIKKGPQSCDFNPGCISESCSQYAKVARYMEVFSTFLHLVSKKASDIARITQVYNETLLSSSEEVEPLPLMLPKSICSTISALKATPHQDSLMQRQPCFWLSCMRYSLLFLRFVRLRLQKVLSSSISAPSSPLLKLENRLLEAYFTTVRGCLRWITDQGR